MNEGKTHEGLAGYTELGHVSPAEASLISSPLGDPTGPATPRFPVSFAAASKAPDHYHGERRAQLVGR